MGNVSGPLLATGTADAIVSTEPVEALRNIVYANKETKVITDINPVIPFTVVVGGEEYPNLDDVFTEIQSRAELYKIDALYIAKVSGGVITKNVVILGALAATDVLPFKSDVLLETILDNVPSRYKDINKKAFENGMEAIKNLRFLSLVSQNNPFLNTFLCSHNPQNKEIAPRNNSKFLIRAIYNRCVAHECKYLWDAIQQCSIQGYAKVKVSRANQRKTENCKRKV